MKSPCIKICELNNAGFCIACKRHLDEIEKWIYLSKQERMIIMEDLPSRK
jgi:uncharacterized protein